MTETQKKWIDEASYEAMLCRWRFSPSGDRMFQGETGDYFIKVMREKKKKIGDDGHVAVSKRLGWS
jgi:hypothetical protein